MWWSFIEFRVEWVIRGFLFFLRCASKGFVNFLFTVKTCLTELPLLFVAISDESAIRTLFRSWGHSDKNLWQLCTHELLILFSPFDQFFDFINSRILSACHSQMFLDGNGEFFKKASINITVGFFLFACFVFFLTCFRTSEIDSWWGRVWAGPIENF